MRTVKPEQLRKMRTSVRPAGIRFLIKIQFLEHESEMTVTFLQCIPEKVTTATLAMLLEKRVPIAQQIGVLLEMLH
jgi:hypothetical protein